MSVAIPRIGRNRLREITSKFYVSTFSLHLNYHQKQNQNQNQLRRDPYDFNHLLPENSFKAQSKFKFKCDRTFSNRKQRPLHILLTLYISKFRIACRGVTEFIQAPETRLDQRSYEIL